MGSRTTPHRGTGARESSRTGPPPPEAVPPWGVVKKARKMTRKYEQSRIQRGTNSRPSDPTVPDTIKLTLAERKALLPS